MKQFWKKLDQKKRRIAGWAAAAVAAAFLMGLFVHAGEKKIRQEVTVVPADPGVYEETFETAGSVQSGKVTMVPLPGVVLEVYVKKGQSVSEGDALARVEAGEEEKDVTAPKGGIVEEIAAGSIGLADPSAYEAAFSVPARVRWKMQQGMQVRVDGEGSTVTFLSSAAEFDGDKEIYAACASLPEGAAEGIGAGVQVEVPLGPQQEAWKIPAGCVMRFGGKAYVFYASWLDHVTDLQPADYEEIEVLDEEDGALWTAPLSQAQVLELTDFSRRYLQEVLGAYL